jgi:hypothetical protein
MVMQFLAFEIFHEPLSALASFLFFPHQIG